MTGGLWKAAADRWPVSMTPEHMLLTGSPEALAAERAHSEASVVPAPAPSVSAYSCDHTEEVCLDWNLIRGLLRFIWFGIF